MLFNLLLTKTYSFTKINPDKGTETNNVLYSLILRLLFTKINPDKGTETKDLSFSEGTVSLQRLTPIRGRKLIRTLSPLKTSSTTKFTKINPDKGTETF